MARGGHGGGRICPSDRNTDNATAIIGGNVALSEEHQTAVVSTEAKSMKDSCRRDYRNRNTRFIKWLEASRYTEVAQEGIRPFTTEEKSNPLKYCFGHEKDLKFSGFNVAVLLAFLSETKVKKVDTTGKIYLKTFEDLRKYGDAIQWGAEMAGERLPLAYFERLYKWKKAYKKEYAEAKADGRTEENDAEPISSTLFTMMCMWAVQENNIGRRGTSMFSTRDPGNHKCCRL